MGECADIWYKRIQPTVATKQLANAPCESEMTYRLTVLLFCDVHINNDTELPAMRVICECRAVQTNSAGTSMALLFM